MNAEKINEKKYGKGTLILAIVLSAAAAIGAWEALRSPNQAIAAPRYNKPDPLDAGVQRQTLIAEQKKATAKIGELVTLLKSGKVKVIAVEEKDSKRKKR